MKDKLFEAARAAAKIAHAPYSQYPVGAAILTPAGHIHSGCNIENVSSPEGWCAETTAIAHMVMHGERAIAEVCVFAERAAKATPCGGCRQRLMEFGKASTPVHLCDADGIVETVTLGDLLPFAFDISESGED